METVNRVKQYMKLVLPVLALIVLDQTVKIFISQYFPDRDFYFIDHLLGFRPQLNTDYSWINNIGNLGVSLLTHIVITVLIIIVAGLIYGYMFDNCLVGKLENRLFTFLFAGAICSFIDKVFWGGSLDYILLEGFFIFDLKDVYITVFEIMILCCFLFNYKGLRRLNERKFFYDLRNYIKVKYIKK